MFSSPDIHNFIHICTMKYDALAEYDSHFAALSGGT